jgi:very-short-patch-repair endonuclease
MPPRGLTLRRARSLRASLTPPEVALWVALRRRDLGGIRFRRQHPLGPWVLDFYCAERRLAVEVDGQGHNHGPLGRDERRDSDLAQRGVRVLRFTAADVMGDIEAVLATILAEAAT